MKILHVSPTYYSTDSVVGGGEKYILYMIRALVKYATKFDSPMENLLLAFGDLPGNYCLGGDIVCEVMPGKPWDPFSIFLDDLLARLNQFDIIIVHQCLTVFGMFVASHATLAGKIVVGVDEGGGEHSLISHTSESGRIFDCFLAYSYYGANAFFDLNVPVKVILGPVDTDYYKPSYSKKRDKSLVVAVGRLLPHKGFDRIVKVLPDSLRLVIIGSSLDKDYFNYLQTLIKNSASDITIVEGLSDSEVRDLLSAASLFIHASTHFDYKGVYYTKPELLGLAPLEALACGTPALVSSAGSLGELKSITGCRVFSSDAELVELLYLHVTSQLHSSSPTEIYTSVSSLYGLSQFGEKLFHELKALECGK